MFDLYRDLDRLLKRAAEERKMGCVIAGFSPPSSSPAISKYSNVSITMTWSTYCWTTLCTQSNLSINSLSFG